MLSGDDLRKGWRWFEIRVDQFWITILTRILGLIFAPKNDPIFGVIFGPQNGPILGPFLACLGGSRGTSGWPRTAGPVPGSFLSIFDEMQKGWILHKTLSGFVSIFCRLRKKFC